MRHPTDWEMNVGIARLMGAQARHRTEVLPGSGQLIATSKLWEWTNPLGMMGEPYPDLWEPLPDFWHDLNACTQFMVGDTRFTLQPDDDGRWRAESGYTWPGYDQPTIFIEDTPSAVLCVAFWERETAHERRKTVAP